MNIALAFVIIAVVIALLIPFGGIIKTLLEESGVDVQRWLSKLPGGKKGGE
ncbi:MAG: hypothetical protein AB7E49_09420 [Campylobacterales bacterium]